MRYVKKFTIQNVPIKSLYSMLQIGVRLLFTIQNVPIKSNLIVFFAIRV